MPREEKMVATKYQVIMFYTGKNFRKKDKKETFHQNKKKEKKPKNTKRDSSNVRCYTCDENAKFSRDFPIRKRRHHAHVVEDDEPTDKIFK